MQKIVYYDTDSVKYIDVNKEDFVKKNKELETETLTYKFHQACLAAARGGYTHAKVRTAQYKED